LLARASLVALAGLRISTDQENLVVTSGKKEKG